MMVRTSAKSTLMRPGTVMMSEMPWTPWRSTSSAARQGGRQPGGQQRTWWQFVSPGSLCG
jgi:hypothetical protein